MIGKIKSLINDGEKFTGFVVDFDDSNEIASSQWLSEIEVFNETHLKKHPLYNRIHRLCFHKKTDRTCVEMLGVLKTLEKEFESTKSTTIKTNKKLEPQFNAEEKFQSVIDNLNYSLEGIKTEIFAYNNGGNITNFFNKLEEGISKQDFNLISRSITDIHNWYVKNINDIQSNDYCFNKNELKENLEIILKTKEDLLMIDVSGGIKLTENKKEKHKKMKEKKIFISHASADKAYMELLVDLLEFIGLDDTNLICTSVTGFGIPLGRPIYDFLRDSFNDYELHVIFAHSHNFYTRPICLNEMGAAWVAKTKYTSILLPDFNYNEMTGVVDSGTLAIKLDDERTEVYHRLDELYEIIAADFNLKKAVPARWEQKRNAFLDSVLRQLNSTKSKNPLKSSDILKAYEQQEKEQKIERDVTILLQTANQSKVQNSVIMRVQDLGGVTIQAGGTAMNIRGDGKDTAKWENILKIALSRDLIEQTNNKGTVFKITNEGYEFLEE